MSPPHFNRLSDALFRWPRKCFELVEIDFPQGKSLSPEVRKQNDALQQQYNVQGFPTLVLLSPDGKVIKQQSGYIPGGPKGFIEWVSSK